MSESRHKALSSFRAPLKGLSLIVGLIDWSFLRNATKLRIFTAIFLKVSCYSHYITRVVRSAKSVDVRRKAGGDGPDG